MPIWFRNRYKNEAATSLPASNELAIITTGQNAPVKILASPYMLKNAADPAIDSVVIINMKIKNILIPHNVAWGYLCFKMKGEPVILAENHTQPLLSMSRFSTHSPHQT